MQVLSRKLRIGILPVTVPRVNDATAHAVPRVGTHSTGRTSGSVSQRNEAQGHVTFETAPRVLTRIRQDSRCTDVVEAGSRKKNLFPALIDRNQKRLGGHFYCVS
jgi:hypothetical protein